MHHYRHKNNGAVRKFINRKNKARYKADPKPFKKKAVKWAKSHRKKVRADHKKWRKKNPGKLRLYRQYSSKYDGLDLLRGLNA